MKSKAFLFIAAMLTSHVSWAFAPENGWWWNPVQPGVGYNIESQSGTMFVATFVYDEDGNPVWYSGAGQINRENIVTINLLRSSGGQCLGCVYTMAQSGDSGYQITLSFSDDSHGIVRLNGVEMPIERFNFNLGSGVEKLLGVWIMNIAAPVINSLGVSDTIAYTRIEEGAAVGRRAFSSSYVSVVTPAEGMENTYVSVTQLSGVQNMVAVFNLSGLNVALGLAAMVDFNATAEGIAQKLQEASALFVGFRAASAVDISNASTASVSSIATAAQLSPDSAQFAQIRYQANEIAAIIDREAIEKIMQAVQIK